MTDNPFTQSPGWQKCYQSCREFANSGEQIYGFWNIDENMQWLSNMQRCDINYLGETFRTVEHAYQAAKAPDNEAYVEAIIDTNSPYKAKMLSRQIVPVDGWYDGLKLSVMDELVEQKFMREDLAILLAATGDAEIIEANSHGDHFYGVDMISGDGANHLGVIIMRKRKIVCDLLRMESGRVPHYELAGSNVRCFQCRKPYGLHPSAQCNGLTLHRMCNGKWAFVQA